MTDLQDRPPSSSLDIEQPQNAQDEREAELMISVTTANKDKVVSEITLLVSPGQQKVDNYTKTCSIYVLTLGEFQARDLIRELASTTARV